MNVIKMPLSALKKPERNVRIHTEKQLREFERSITMFGQIRPIVVDETNTILAGVGCFETLVRMEAEEAAVYRIENLTENQKKKLMIADNKLFGLGIDDIDTFNAFLEELQTDLDIPGYDEDILQSMVAEAEDVSDKISTYGTIDDAEIEEIRAAIITSRRTIYFPFGALVSRYLFLLPEAVNPFRHGTVNEDMDYAPVNGGAVRWVVVFCAISLILDGAPACHCTRK